MVEWHFDSHFILQSGIAANVFRFLCTVFLLLALIDAPLNIFQVTSAIILLVTIYYISDAMRNLGFLAMGNTIHVGEIISISSPGHKPGDNPYESVIGFVEAITW